MVAVAPGVVAGVVVVFVYIDVVTQLLRASSRLPTAAAAAF